MFAASLTASTLANSTATVFQKSCESPISSTSLQGSIWAVAPKILNYTNPTRKQPMVRNHQEAAYYDKIANQDWCQNAIDHLIETAREHRTAIMCGEEDPERCHRYHLVGRALVRKGVECGIFV